MNFPFAPTPGIRHATKNFRRVVDVDPTVDSLLRWSLHNDAEATPVSAYGAALCRFVGGKRQQLPQFEPLWPRDVSERVFIDPTMGSNSVFLHLAPRLQAHGAILADVNPTLVNAMKVVKYALPELQAVMTPLVQGYNTAAATGATSEQRRENANQRFLAIRDLQRVRAFEFGDFPDEAYGRFDGALRRVDGSAVDPRAVSDAAVFLMIVWTGFNGLWRVNGAGAVNTPHGGQTKKAAGVDHWHGNVDVGVKFHDLDIVSRALNSIATDIRLVRDFSDLTSTIVELVGRAGSSRRARALVYADPPYVPVKKAQKDAGGKTSAKSFTSYAKDDFDIEDHHRLANWFRWLDAECNGGSFVDVSDTSAGGVDSIEPESLAFDMRDNDPRLLFMVSNSDTPESRRIMRGYDIRDIKRRSSVSCDSESRGAVNDIVSRNYT